MTMRAIKDILTEIRQTVDQTLQEDVASDPFGHACLLASCLENRYQSATVDFLVDWMNEWIDQVLNHRNVSRQLDREVGAAVLGFLVLEKHGFLKTTVDEASLVHYLSEVFDDRRGFFGSFLHSAIILDFLKKKAASDYLTERAERYVRRRLSEPAAVFNDPVNLAVWAYFLAKKDSPDVCKELFRFGYKRLIGDALNHQQRLYYTLSLWKLREDASKQERREISLVAVKLLNAFTPAGPSPLGGRDADDIGSAGPSKLALAAHFELATAVGPHMVVIPKEQSEFLGMARIGGAVVFLLSLGMVVFVLNSVITFAGWADVADMKMALFLKLSLGSLVETARLMLAAKLLGAFVVFLVGIGVLVVVGTFACYVCKNAVYHGIPHFRVNVRDTLAFLQEHLKVVFLFGFIANVFVFLVIK